MSEQRIYRISLGDNENPADVRMIFAKTFADAYVKARRIQKEMNFREVVEIKYIGEVEQ